MPLFEYTCHGCQETFELLVRSGEVPQCARCGGTNLSKLLSGFAVKGAKQGRPVANDGGPQDCIGNQAARARAKGSAPCC